MSDDIAISDLFQEVPEERTGFKPMNETSEEVNKHVDTAPGGLSIHVAPELGNIVIGLPTENKENQEAHETQSPPQSPALPAFRAPPATSSPSQRNEPNQVGSSTPGWLRCAIPSLICFLAVGGIVFGLAWSILDSNANDFADSETNTGSSTTSISYMSTSLTSVGVESNLYALGCQMTLDFKFCSLTAATIRKTACFGMLEFGLVRIDQEEALRKPNISAMYLDVTDPSRANLAVSFQFDLEDSLAKAEAFQQHLGSMTSSAIVSYVNKKMERHLPDPLLNSMDSISCCVSHVTSGSWAHFLASGSDGDVFPQWLQTLQTDDPQVAQNLMDKQARMATCLFSL